MRYILYIILSAVAISTSAQIGINTTNPINGVLHIDAKGNNPTTGLPNGMASSDDLFINSLGNMALGHTIPLSKLHLKSAASTRGAIKIQDGSQGNTKILKSDEFGNASWGYAGEILTITGKLGTGTSLIIHNYTLATDFVYTGSTITLSPGKWLVMVTMNLTIGGVSTTDQSIRVWIRSTFSDSETGGYSTDIEGATKISGLGYAVGVGSLNGFITINNKTKAAKTYYYMLTQTRVLTIPDSSYLIDFGGNSYPENKIIAIKMRDN